MSALTIINEALVRVGANPIASLDDASAQALAATNLFYSVSDELLADFPWTFALRERSLARFAERGDRLLAGKYTFQLPSDSLRVLGLLCHTPFRLAGDQLYSDAEDARLVYIAKVAPSAWSAGFRQLVALELAAAFAITITDSSNRANLFYAEAARVRPRLRSLDSQQTPAQVFELMRIYARPGMNLGMG